MSYKYMIVDKAERIGFVKINRPDVYNAVNLDAIVELERAIQSLREDDDVMVIIITGEGKAFVSGSDISKLVEMNSMSAREYSQIGQRVLSLIENIEKPVIAAVNGFALGSGCELAMACDMRIASEKAKFGQPEVKLGLIPGHAGTQRLARLVGAAKAKELIFTGEMIDAQEALRIGLVNKIVAPESLLDEAKNLAKRIMEVGPTAVRIAKTVINRGVDANLTTANSYETEAFSILFSTEEAKEGMKAFLEKRRPKWAG